MQRVGRVFVYFTHVLHFFIPPMASQCFTSTTVHVPHRYCCLTRPVVLLVIAAGLGQVLEFMYTAKLTLSPQNVEDVLAVANFLQMQEIVNACSAYQSMANPAPSLITLDFAVGESGLMHKPRQIFMSEPLVDR